MKIRPPFEERFCFVTEQKRFFMGGFETDDEFSGGIGSDWASVEIWLRAKHLPDRPGIQLRGKRFS